MWHGRVPFADYEKHFNRFVSEYGFQSFPEMRTVEAFKTPLRFELSVKARDRSAPPKVDQ